MPADLVTFIRESAMRVRTAHDERFAPARTVDDVAQDMLTELALAVGPDTVLFVLDQAMSTADALLGAGLTEVIGPEWQREMIGEFGDAFGQLDELCD